MTITVRDFKPEDADRIDYRPTDRREMTTVFGGVADYPAIVKAAALTSVFCWTLLEDQEPIAVGGLQPITDTQGTCLHPWVIGKEAMLKKPILFHKLMKSLLEDVLKIKGGVPLKTKAPRGDRVRDKWLHSLGFRVSGKQGSMVEYTHD